MFDIHEFRLDVLFGVVGLCCGCCTTFSELVLLSSDGRLGVALGVGGAIEIGDDGGLDSVATGVGFCCGGAGVSSCFTGDSLWDDAGGGASRLRPAGAGA